MKPLATLLLAPLLLAPPLAPAFTVTGWFQGTVINGDVTPINHNPPHPLEYFLGAPATGHFTITIDEETAALMPFGDLLPMPGTMDVGVTVRGVDFSYQSGGGGIHAGRWQTEATGSQLGFWTDWRPRFEGHILDFFSDDGALLDGPTPADYQLNSGTVDRMAFYFASARESAWFNVGVTSFGFGALAAPVPEPGLAWLLALGVAGLAAHQRWKDRTASRKVPS